MKKARRLNLQQMWDVYRLNQKASGLAIKKTLDILYPNESINRLSMDERIVLYVNGITFNGLESFASFVDSLKRHNGR